MGIVEIPAIVDKQIIPFKLTNVRHVLGININLLSTTQFDIEGYYYKEGDSQKTFYDSNGNVVFQSYLHDRTYYLDTKWDHKTLFMRRLKLSELVKNDASWTTWHCRFGHISMEATKALVKYIEVDCEAADRLQKHEPQELCSLYMSGKIHRNPSRIPVTRSSVKGHTWSINLSIASNVVTLEGYKHILSIKNKATGMVRIVYFRDRSNLHQHIEQELRYLHTDDIKVARIRCDNELLFSAIYKELYRK